jgi:hypothetical protein
VHHERVCEQFVQTDLARRAPARDAVRGRIDMRSRVRAEMKRRHVDAVAGEQ